jgi:UDP:flavonoid glycosyltransferase YjiC (YdhE family)
VCKVEATNCGLRREVKELKKKTIRGLIQEVDHYQQRQQQAAAAAAATMCYK